MNKLQFNEIAFVNFANFAIGNDEFLNEFRNETSIDLKVLENRNPLMEAIDKATGYQDELISKFIIWIADNFWGNVDEIKCADFEIYKKAKRNINENENASV